MARTARTVVPDIPHHIVQRGNRRERVFFDDRDRYAYLTWLAQYCDQFRVQVLAYCLMSNHVHLVAVPPAVDALDEVFQPLHTRYAQRINRRRGWSGHLWQGRFFSSPLDEAYMWNAIRYVEQNPVRAGLVARAEDHPWSSAPAHCGLRTDPVLTRNPAWLDTLGEVADWAEWLSGQDPPEKLASLRKHGRRNWPCGSAEFIAQLERLAGVPLCPQRRGRRPAKSTS